MDKTKEVHGLFKIPESVVISELQKELSEKNIKIGQLKSYIEELVTTNNYGKCLERVLALSKEKQIKYAESRYHVLDKYYVRTDNIYQVMKKHAKEYKTERDNFREENKILHDKYSKLVKKYNELFKFLKDVQDKILFE